MDSTRHSVPRAPRSHRGGPATRYARCERGYLTSPRAGRTRPTVACRTPRDKPPAAAEPLGSHCRCESATTQPLDFRVHDDDVGEFANVGTGEDYGSPRGESTVLVQLRTWNVRIRTPNVRRRRFCALGPPRDAHCVRWRAPCSAHFSFGDAGGSGRSEEQGLEAPGTEADRLLGKRERVQCHRKETAMSKRATTGNHDPGRDRQPGVRHGRAGSDAAISLEEGGTVPGTG